MIICTYMYIYIYTYSVYIVPSTNATTSTFSEIACDGIWDVKSSAEVCTFLRKRLMRESHGSHGVRKVGTGYCSY